MMLSLIVALDQNGLIGNQNGLPWRLPADLKHFKETTMGKPVIMGRLTAQSIGRPLPGRRNLVLTGNTDFRMEGFEMFHSPESVLQAVQTDEEVMVIGGAKIYNAFWPNIQRAYITLIGGSFDGDTWFPEWPLASVWCLKTTQNCPPDEKNAYPMSFMVYEKLEKN
jgi:dihydrofolate reductase